MESNINSKYYIANIEKAHFAGEATLPNSIPSISNFVGREDYLAELRDENGTRCFVLHGTGGVGKTAMALQFAGEIADEYEAKVYVEMNGMSENPLSARGAMFDVVRQFEREIPADISDAQLKELFVQKVQNQPTLIVLDNAANKESVESLKQTKACLIITSRHSFVLTGGKSKQIFKMSPEDARKLLFEIAGEERFDGRADELANLAGYLPMALKPLASILAEDDLETVADLINRYRDKKELLKERVSDYDDLTIEASFGLSYDKLSDEMKEHWRRLSVLPADFDEAAITSVLDISADKARETQKQLRRFSLLEVNPETKRFNLHDLVRVFTDAKLDDDERFQTQFLHAKHYASILITAERMKTDRQENHFANALKLIDTEWSNITAGQKWTAENFEKDNRIAELCTDYCGYARDFTTLRLNPRQDIKWLEIDLMAAQSVNNRQVEGNSLGNLGIAYNRLGEYRKAIDYHQQSLAISREIGDRSVEGSSLGNLGLAYQSLGEYRKAIDYHEQSLAISREIGDRSVEGNSLVNLGLDYHSLGEVENACGLWKEALAILEAIESPNAVFLRRLIEENCPS